IGTHPPITLRCKLGQFIDQSAAFIEQLLGLVALHPTLKLRNVLRMLWIDEEWYLMRPEGSLNLEAIDDLRARPSLGRSEYNHRPARPRGVLGSPRSGLELPDILDGPFQHGGHEFMHRRRIVAFDEVRSPATS